MIYVITEPRYVSSITTDELKKGTSFTTEPCIKIGYTTNLASRMSQYMTDTPRLDILYTYDEGTEEDEKRLHLLFKEYQSSDLNGREWFSWSADIINFFESNTTIDDVRSNLPEIIKPKKTKREEKEAEEKLSSLILPALYLLVDLGLEENIISFPDLETFTSEIFKKSEKWLAFMSSIKRNRDIFLTSPVF